VELAEIDLRAYELRKVLRIAETLHCFSWVVGFRCVDAYQSHLFVRADDDCVAVDSDAKEFTRRMVENKSIRLAFDESNRARIIKIATVVL
jgi:hypothetical protein